MSYYRRIRDALRRGRQFALYDVWRIGAPGEDVPRGFIIQQIRVAILLVSNLAQGTVMLRASALTFATILSIVPFLAVMFYIIQTFNLGDSLYASLETRLESGISTVTEYIPGFDRDDPEIELPEDIATESEATPAIENASTSVEEVADPVLQPVAVLDSSTEALPAIDSGGETTDSETAFDDPSLIAEAVLDESSDIGASEQDRALQRELMRSFFRRVGSTEDSDYVDPVERLAGLADEAARNSSAVSVAGILLLFTTVFGLMRNIEKSFNSIWGVKRTRSWYRMVSDYVMITLLLPFVAAAVFGVTAALQSEIVLELLGPLALVVRSLQTVLIMLVFSGLYLMVPNTRVRKRYALMGGFVAGSAWLLLSWAYVEFQIGITRYNLVFSTFAQFPVLLMWIYASWVILLFGAELSYAYQNERTFAMERWADGASYAYRETVGLRAMLEIARRFENGLKGLDPNESAAEWNVPSRLLRSAVHTLEEAELVTECNTEPVTYQPARPLERIRVGEVITAMREDGRDPSLFRQDDRYRELFDVLDNTEAVFDKATVKQLLSEVQLTVHQKPEPDDEPDGSEAHAS